MAPQPNAGAIPGTHEPGFTEHAIQPMPWGAMPPPPAGTLYGQWYRMGHCSVYCARERAGPDHTYLWHASISCPDRHPTWDEIKVVRYRLLPLDRTFGIMLPPPDQYVNLPQQDHVFHLWEIDDPRAL